MKLRTRIYLIFLNLALIPLIIITVLAYSRYSEATYERMDEITGNIFRGALSELNTVVKSIEDSAGQFTFYSDGNFSIIQSLQDFADPGKKPDNYTILKANNDIKYVCSNILYSYPYIYGVYVFTPSGAVLSYTSRRNGDLLYDYRPYGDQWYLDTLALEGKLYTSSIEDHAMFSGGEKSLFFARALYDVYSHQFLGVLMLDCDPSLFNLDNINSMPDITRFRLTNDRDGTILYDTGETAFLETEKDLTGYSSALSMETLTFRADFDYHTLAKEFNFTAVLLLVMASVCAAVILIVSYFLAKNVTYPIEHLSKKMRSQNGSHLTLSSRYLNRSDEIGTLYNEYNSMVEELNASIKKDYQDKLIALDAQMRSLEAQINSHFLFNTLESINSLAELDDNDRISTMVLALGNMFRYSIKTQSELVPIEDEIRHVQDYVSIQRIRFDNRFRLDMEIPESMNSIKVLKLILQPLVENALYHGLNYCACGDRITISGSTDSSYIYLCVSDNGTGMDRGELLALREKLDEKPSFTELGHRTGQSIGLKNIHTRIELYYGKGYGLTLNSREKEGTQIQIKLPYLR